jgi:hypothetical protein
MLLMKLPQFQVIDRRVSYRDLDLLGETNSITLELIGKTEELISF